MIVFDIYFEIGVIYPLKYILMVRFCFEQQECFILLFINLIFFLVLIQITHLCITRQDKKRGFNLNHQIYFSASSLKIDY